LPLPGGGSEGSIPACTGEPIEGPPKLLFVKVYPRVYGGTSYIPATKKFDIGLSPRVRGNLDYAYASSPGIGSIPACTGEP